MSPDPRRFVPDLIRWEGETSWMYRDSGVAGLVTIGIGNMLPDADAAVKLPFVTADPGGLRPSTEAEVRDDYARVLSMPPGLLAARYRSPHAVELLAAHVEDLAASRLAIEFLPGLRHLCPDFDSFPAPAQSALVDIAWNVGIGAPSTPVRRATGLCGFPTMLRYCNQRRWADAALECHRGPPVRVERNDWTRSKFLEASQTVTVA